MQILINSFCFLIKSFAFHTQARIRVISTPHTKSKYAPTQFKSITTVPTPLHLSHPPPPLSVLQLIGHISQDVQKVLNQRHPLCVRLDKSFVVLALGRFVHVQGEALELLGDVCALGLW